MFFVLCMCDLEACVAADKNVRLRFAWGSGNSAKQRWTGSITIDDGLLTELRPLGIEVDAPVAQRIDGNRLIVAPLQKRGFDGCDVMVRADEQARVRVELRNEQAPQAQVIEATLSEVVANQLRQPLDEFGSFFLARRSPGDELRVLPTREHYVFKPGETWSLKLQPDLAAYLQAGPVLLDVQLRATGESKPSWRSSQQISEASQLEDGVGFVIECPRLEGAYRLTVSATPEEGFATRFVPGQQAKPVATRDVEFVVIDPEARLPRLVDQWQPVLTIDPANPSWWQRLPSWAQVPRLRGRTPGAVGNIRPVVRPSPSVDLVELPPAPTSGDPYWQSYTLPVREPGQPHLVEIEYPAGLPQHLAISLVEPDAAGRVTETQQDASLFSEGRSESTNGEVAVHRFLIWPRTRSPQLLLVNRHPSASSQFGRIRLLKQDSALAALTQSQSDDESERTVAGYLAKPTLASSFGAAEWLDAQSGLSVQSWSTFLTATQRLAQTLRFNGCNGIMISVSADGSAIYPSQVINPSPRYDTGQLAASGQDPTRKDVLEMMLRVFDREGLRVFPAVQLAAPLPRLESLRQAGDSRVSGLGLVGQDGQTWLEKFPTYNGLAPFYNSLNDNVQAELTALVGELTSRYGDHESFAGVGVQLSGEGYGLLPGIAWGVDDATVAQFSRSTGRTLPQQGDERFQERANLLLSDHRQVWLEWRQEKLSQLYTKLAQQVTATREDTRLILATEDLFTGNELKQRVRQAIAEPVDFGQILRAHGIDLTRLDARSEITALLPNRMNAASQLQAQAIDLRVRAASEQGDLLDAEQRSAELLFYPSSRLALPSFDERSPFGAEQTYLTVSTQPRPHGNSRAKPIVTALANEDASMIFSGGFHADSVSDARLSSIRRTLQQLPTPSTEVSTLQQQPIVVRLYRTKDATVLTVINEARWPVQAEVMLAGSQTSEWRALGADGQTTELQGLAGTLNATQQLWQVDLQPYDLKAWRFTDEKLRIGDVKVAMSELATLELQQRIQAIESRAGNLNIERAYAQLQNPGFELQDNGLSIIGWQAVTGRIELSQNNPRSGANALRLSSEGATPAGVRSHLFPTTDTGQLLVSFYLRFASQGDDANLQISVEDQDEGRRYRQFALLGGAQVAEGGWSRYEFALNDVPFGDEEQLRLKFELTGNAEALIDDIELYDLRFDDTRRRAMVKRIYAAKKALDQGQIVDCQRVVYDYWSRYLVENVPPTEPVPLQAAKQPPKVEVAEEEDESGIRSRLRGWVPKVLR